MKTSDLKYYFLLIILAGSINFCAGQAGYGHPVFKQDFGIGNSNPATIGTPLPLGKTYFTFSTATCPSPDTYTIIRRVPVANCFNNEWIGLSHDNNIFVEYGMMMAVNNIVKGVNRTVYTDTVNKPLCPGEIYRFSAAVINLDLIDGSAACPSGPDYPVFELRIEDGIGNVIKKDTTSPLPSYAAPPLMGYKFTEVGFNFTMPAGVNQLVLKLTLLNRTYQCAEDFAVDDIQIRPIGPEVVIGFDLEPPTTIVKSICFQHNSTVQMSGTMGAYYPNPVLQWQQSTDNGISWTDIPGATNAVYARTFSTPDTFLFRLSGGDAATISNPNCRVVSNTRRVEVDGLPKNYTITNNSPVCAGQDLQFKAEGAATYIWTGPNGFFDNIPFPHIFNASLNDSGMYYVEIFSLGGCQTTDSTFARVIGTNVDAWPDTIICKGESVMLQASAGASYEWQPAREISNSTIANPRVSPAATTAYIVNVKDNFGCSDTAMVQVTVRNAVQVKAGIKADMYICRPQDSLLFEDNSTGVIKTWNWTFGNGQFSATENPSIQYYTIAPSQHSFVARLAVTDTSGCSDTAYHFINVAENCFIAVPSGFTPNNDGRNDFLYPLNAYKARQLLFRVYTRAGQLIFESKDWGRRWDGRFQGIEQPTGIYIWTLEYADRTGKLISLKGTTLLIR
jgi:gliding motility-associated-like protein